MGSEPPVGGEAPTNGSFSDSSSPKKIIILSKNCQIFLFVYSEIFCIFLESSETRFDLVASKIGAKLNNFVIYDDILVNF